MGNNSAAHSQWIELHNQQYDLRAKNEHRRNKFSEETLSLMYKDKLRIYFKKFPDQITEHYEKLLND